MREVGVKASFALPGIKGGSAEALGERRALDVRGGKFDDDFKPYEAHLYRIK